MAEPGLPCGSGRPQCPKAVAIGFASYLRAQKAARGNLKKKKKESTNSTIVIYKLLYQLKRKKRNQSVITIVG